MVNSEHLTSIHWEISSACQAACPCCTRKNSNRALANFQQTYTSLEQVKKTLSSVASINQITFCGNVGDSMANPDIADIATYIREKFKECTIQINTNGGIGRPENFASLAKTGVQMIFGVDGTSGINELHRYNVKFSQIEKNIRSFADNKENGSKLIVQFLVWDQNIGNLPDMVEWCRKVGVDFLHVRESNGLDLKTSNGLETPISNNLGTVVHTLTKNNTAGYRQILNREFSNDQFDHLLNEWQQLPVNRSEPALNQVEDQFTDTLAFVPKSSYREQRFLDQAPWPIDSEQQTSDAMAKKYPIRCISLVEKDNRPTLSIYISYDGYVFPCCFIGTAFAQAQSGQYTSVSLINRLHELGIDRINTHLRSLVEILDDTVLNELAFDKLHTEDKLPFCGQTCKTDSPYMTYQKIGPVGQENFGQQHK